MYDSWKYNMLWNHQSTKVAWNVHTHVCKYQFSDYNHLSLYKFTVNIYLSEPLSIAGTGKYMYMRFKEHTGSSYVLASTPEIHVLYDSYINSE